MSKYLPTQPNLRQLRNQAKDLVKAHRAGNPDEARRIGANLPRLSAASEAAILSGSFALQEAQHVIAREYGFPSWKLLTAYAKTEPTNDSRYRSYLPDKEAGAMERAEEVVWHMAMDEHRISNSVVRYQADVDVGTEEWDLRVHKIIRVRTWETPEEKETTNSYSVMDFITIRNRQLDTSATGPSKDWVEGEHRMLDELRPCWPPRVGATCADLVFCPNPPHIQIAEYDEKGVSASFVVRSERASKFVHLFYPRETIEEVAPLLEEKT